MTCRKIFIFRIAACMTSGKKLRIFPFHIPCLSLHVTETSSMLAGFQNIDHRMTINADISVKQKANNHSKVI